MFNDREYMFKFQVNVFLIISFKQASEIQGETEEITSIF